MWSALFARDILLCNLGTSPSDCSVLGFKWYSFEFEMTLEKTAKDVICGSLLKLVERSSVFLRVFFIQAKAYTAWILLNMANSFVVSEH